ncbi:PREDICTED: cytochrome P450 4C1-like, partial [Vollenhovia emeryi]|uniref:cytochrome P450 4C1-like n=1 Tax=Vollenhovia emeryi TaxID=411798 RepID=UPI0005F415CE
MFASVTEILIYVIIAVISYYTLDYIFIRRLTNLPGPKTWPVLGNYPLLWHHIEPLNMMLRFAEEYSSPFHFWLGSNLFIGIYDPQQAQAILHDRNCLDKSIIYKLFKPLFGMGLFTAPASIWTRLRKISARTFRPSILQDFFKIFVEESDKLTNELNENTNEGEEIILIDIITQYAWKMACRTMMGIKLGQEKNKKYVKAIQRCKNNFTYRIKNILLFFDGTFSITAMGRKQKKDMDFINSLGDEMIQQLKHDHNNPNTTDGNNRTHTTFYQILMAASQDMNFTDKDFHDNIMTMLVTASDTISAVINFVTFILANFPEIQV